MKILSPAKLNLVLDILRKRKDGYHEVDFVMQELMLRDEVEIESVQDSSHILISCTDPAVPIDEKNTCYRAVQLMQEECRKKGKTIQGARIHIEKRIPSAGGLGGGSSNAASVLKGLNGLWKLDLSKNVLADLAGKIGSDVPFFIYGKTCRAQGRGEIITSISPCPVLHLAFIVPPVNVPPNKTQWIYSHFSVDKVMQHPSVENMMRCLSQSNSSAETIASHMGNAFEYLDIPQYDVVFSAIEQIKKLPGVFQCMLAGAGPTIVAVCDSEKTTSQLIQPFRMQGWVAFATQTVKRATAD
ncbi:MAG: 4-(cytidine 5'-diphospho)-2-C-methyl-D-erythritol kinase [Candidatus Diapherotrites archaeon]